MGLCISRRPGDKKTEISRAGEKGESESEVGSHYKQQEQQQKQKNIIKTSEANRQSLIYISTNSSLHLASNI